VSGPYLCQIPDQCQIKRPKQKTEEQLPPKGCGSLVLGLEAF